LKKVKIDFRGNIPCKKKINFFLNHFSKRYVATFENGDFKTRFIEKFIEKMKVLGQMSKADNHTYRSFEYKGV